MDNNGRYLLKLTALGASSVPISIFADDQETATPGTHVSNFTLGQNFPNPYIYETNIPFQLTQAADITLYLFDLQEKKVASISRSLSAGDHCIPLNLHSLGLPVGNYTYQLEVKNATGIYSDCKIMTAQP